ncbi:ABC transporter substrate-binding protein [Ornithinicoccus hortensis]|uniref:Osmoprotectant transport system substrate-binding protein n=1 Tax=Ornithinicoccus hortensis TaxID=82346 RepID=A0A542YNJ4_9MICO|nr:ABC transporter substrate-binding protein [Ornithinicoccus hortensis]TQL49631.1 osmoprotectant transport system substrate-binding protein [Ornithinicoccus hortensis]
MIRKTVVPAGILLAALALTACGGSGDPLDNEQADGDAGSGAAGGEGVAIGSANFPGNVLLAEIYAAALEDAGVEVTKTLNIGNRETYIAGLEDGSIDLIPEYTGALAVYFNPDAEATESDAVYGELQDALPDGLTVLEPSSAEDKDSIVVTSETAEEYSLTAIGDLAPEAPNLVLGGPPEFAERPYGVPGLSEVYGLEFASFRPLAAGSNLTVQSLLNGQVDAANIFTTDPAIAENGLVVLEDPESLFAAQNVVPLITEDALTPEIETALNDVSAALSTEELSGMMSEVVTDGQDPATVARAFVDEHL